MSRPIVVFRTNAGSGIGLGHLRRCLTLARAVEALGGECRFIVNRDPAVAAYLRGRGVVAREVSDEDAGDLHETSDILTDWNADACVVDSYEIPGECMERLRGMRVAVLDDLADRPFPVDIVVNGAPGAVALSYRTAPRTRLLLGPEYLLLREEFAGIPAPSIKPRVERVLITVGGMDQQALTPKLIRWLREVLPQAILDVVIGPFFGHGVIRETEALAAADSKTALWFDPPAMRDLMVGADLAVTGGGQTTYELAACGTPAVAIRLGDNQTHNLRALAAAGTLHWIGDGDAPDLQQRLQAVVGRLAGDPATRKEMSRAGRALVDGKGATRVASELLTTARN